MPALIWSEFIATQRFFAAALMQNRERKLAAGVCGGDDGVGGPAGLAKPIISAELGADRGGCRTVEPFASIALWTPVPHAGDIAEEFVDLQWWRADLDPDLARGRCRHLTPLRSSPR